MDLENLPYYDKAHRYGFWVEPEQLAHDLTIVSLLKSTKVEESTPDVLLYEQYCERLHDFRLLIDHRMRYDSIFNQ